MEEVYWTYGYSPVFEADGSIAGVLVVVTETTSRVVAFRRLRTAQNARRSAQPARSDADDIAPRPWFSALDATPEDSPWALAFSTDGDSPARRPRRRQEPGRQRPPRGRHDTSPAAMSRAEPVGEALTRD